MIHADPTAIAPFLALARDLGATDLHLTVGVPPVVRLDGMLEQIAGYKPFDVDTLEALSNQILSTDLAAQLEQRKELDFAFDFEGDRIRANVFRVRGSIGFAFRYIPSAIPDFEELGLPPMIEELVSLPHGLVLVTGPTGSGKSTTLASMIDWINTHRACHVLTIEDPIEYIHDHKRSIVNQREIGPDADDFHSALRSALREDPDVVLVGEMRDPESIAVALSIAETGHLVFATLHTNDTAQALDRIVDVFPAERRDQIQVQLASSLQAVIYQRLMPRAAGGLVAAFEIMRANHAVRNLVREGKTRQLRNIVSTHQLEGMQTLEMSLSALVAEGLVDYETAVGFSIYPREVERPWGTPAPRRAEPVYDDWDGDEGDDGTGPQAGRRGLRRR
ncbi:MAG TPA: type IV pilus twitching motility protein PilT [Acidimicrobiales bacterium]